MDAFYASVEEMDNPSLKGKPVVVGGSSSRSIVTTANYEARKYGIHSAMPIYIAKRKCPWAIFIPNRKERYQEVSHRIFNILHDFTDIIEPLSIDEAYMDIGHIKKDPLRLALEIKARVRKVTGLTMSVGISYNKFLAKLASDWNKPDGIKIITGDMVPDILLPLPVRAVHGIGSKSSKRLNNIGIYTIEDLLALSEDFLIDFFGKTGLDIYRMIRGIDKRKVNPERERKSIGTERTFRRDTRDRNILRGYLYEFAQDLALSLEKRDFYCRTIILKIKYEDFRTQTKSRTLNSCINKAEDIYEIGLQLLNELELNRKLRLIGLTAANLTNLTIEQLSLFDLKDLNCTEDSKNT